MAAGSVQPFIPLGTVSISASTASSSAALPATGDVVLFTNAGPATAFVKVGAGALTASTADVPIVAGGRLLISSGINSRVVAAITGASTATVYATVGNGTAY